MSQLTLQRGRFSPSACMIQRQDGAIDVYSKRESDIEKIDIFKAR